MEPKDRDRTLCMTTKALLLEESTKEESGSIGSPIVSNRRSISPMKLDTIDITESARKSPMKTSKNTSTRI